MKLILPLLFLITTMTMVAQTSTEGVTHIWEGRLVNHQTASMPEKGQTSVFVVHYFAPVATNGISDLFGIFGTANIQMGAEYGLGKNISTFFLSEKINKTQEVGIRYRFVQQTLDGESPVSIAAAFSVSVDARDKKYFGANYYFIDRFFYATQLAVSRQINYRWEMMVNGTLTHFNMVPENSFSTFLSLNPSFAYKLNRTKALFLSFDFPLGIASAAKNNPQKADPLMTLGAILKKPTHNFQLFISNGNQINPAKEYLNNHSGFSLETLRLGFNIHIKIGAK